MSFASLLTETVMADPRGKSLFEVAIENVNCSCFGGIDVPCHTPQLMSSVLVCGRLLSWYVPPEGIHPAGSGMGIWVKE